MQQLADKAGLQHRQQIYSYDRSSEQSDDLKAHVSRVLRDHPALLRDTRVVTDADLLNAEFSWKKKNDDDDSGPASIRHVDLYGGRKLVTLIVSGAEKKDWVPPGLVLTAIRDRGCSGLPTWIVDTTEQPLETGHLSPSITTVLVTRWLAKVPALPATTPPELPASEPPAKPRKPRRHRRRGR